MLQRRGLPAHPRGDQRLGENSWERARWLRHGRRRNPSHHVIFSAAVRPALAPLLVAPLHAQLDTIRCVGQGRAAFLGQKWRAGAFSRRPTRRVHIVPPRPYHGREAQGSADRPPCWRCDLLRLPCENGRIMAFSLPARGSAAFLRGSCLQHHAEVLQLHGILRDDCARPTCGRVADAGMRHHWRRSSAHRFLPCLRSRCRQRGRLAAGHVRLRREGGIRSVFPLGLYARDAVGGFLALGRALGRAAAAAFVWKYARGAC
mmetsp:Transcript_36125/g.104046  ORF Transcript_36125/g.104046 Transcript_36125/m.104046 type:complete len:260 (-) Transcript_36125:198-977(-)